MLTATVAAEEGLGLKLGSPRYWAESWCEPAVKDVVLKVARFPLRVVVPNSVEPSKNSTEPVGLPAPGETTAMVAVKVTDWP